MTNSHRFFQNTDCYYFPCHPFADAENFNCLFCFCPLYFFPDCGGHPLMRGQVKDCSNCDHPHRPGGYEHVVARLTRYFEAAQNERPDADPTDPGTTNWFGSFAFLEVI